MSSGARHTDRRHAMYYMGGADRRLFDERQTSYS